MTSVQRVAASSRVQTDSQRRREELIRFGRELFSRHPYDSLSVDDIAAAAGVSKGLLYHYFQSKRGYYVAVVRAVTDEMRSIGAPDPALTPREQLRQGIEAYLDFAEQHAEAFRTVLDGGVGADEEVRQIVEEIRALYIARILESLSIDPPTPGLRLALRGWLGFSEAATLDWLTHGGVRREDLVRMLLRALNSAFETAGRLDPWPGADAGE